MPAPLTENLPVKITDPFDPDYVPQQIFNEVGLCIQDLADSRFHRDNLPCWLTYTHNEEAIEPLHWVGEKRSFEFMGYDKPEEMPWYPTEIRLKRKNAKEFKGIVRLIHVPLVDAGIKAWLEENAPGDVNFRAVTVIRADGSPTEHHAWILNVVCKLEAYDLEMSKLRKYASKSPNPERVKIVPYGIESIPDLPGGGGKIFGAGLDS